VPRTTTSSITAQVCEKSPIFDQKSPYIPSKEPVYSIQKALIFHPESPYILEPVYSIQKALIFHHPESPYILEPVYSIQKALIF